MWGWEHVFLNFVHLGKKSNLPLKDPKKPRAVFGDTIYVHFCTINFILPFRDIFTLRRSFFFFCKLYNI